MRSLWSVLAATVSGLALAACASSGAYSEAEGFKGEPVRLTFVDHRTSQVCELVNESHTDRLELYSTPRTNATTKVQDDGVLRDLLEWLEDNKFGKLAVEGPAPRLGAGTYWTLEVEGPTGTAHIVETRGTSVKDKQDLRKLVSGFLQTYNVTQAYQAVSVEDQTQLFKGARVRYSEGSTKQ